MKNKTTWIFLLFVAGLGGFAAWDLQTDKMAAETKNQNSILVPFPVDQIQSFSILRKDQKITLDKTIDGWKLSSPLVDWADNAAIEEFVTQLTKQKSLSVISNVQKDLAIYGLNPAAGEITVTHQNKETISYEVGDLRTVEQNTYLRKRGESQLLVAPPDWAVWIKKSPSDFRDRRVLRGPMIAITEIDVKSPAGGLKLVKKDDVWILANHPGIHQDQNRIREMLNQITLTKGEEILLEKNISQADQAKYGLTAPPIELRLKVSDKSWKVVLGPNKDKLIYAMTSDPVFLMRLEEDLYQRLKVLKKSSFKDRKEVFAFKKEMAHKIEFQTALKKQTLMLKDSQWFLEGSDDPPLVPGKVNPLLEQLEKMGLVDFVDGPRNFKATNKIVLKDEQDHLLFEISWDPFEKTKIENLPHTVAVAKTNLSPDLFYIEQTEIDKLRLPELIPTK